MRKNRSDHGMIDHRGIKPEELSPAKDIKKVERCVVID